MQAWHLSLTYLWGYQIVSILREKKNLSDSTRKKQQQKKQKTKTNSPGYTFRQSTYHKRT